MQAHSDPRRESDPHALPDVEVWYSDARESHVYECGCCSGLHPTGFTGDCRDDANRYAGTEDYATRHGMQERDVVVTDCPETGYYWQSCFPGCLPDGEPNGPFETDAEALADAQADALEETE
jgi:hypothetical protein